jgi:hypothetical protein
MKNLFACLLLLTVCARAATIPFNGLNPTQFDTNGLIVKYVADFTNDVGIISPITANTLVTMTNQNVYGTWSTPSKVTLLSLGTNQLDMTLQSAWLLNSPTNDAAQVVLSLSAGAYQGQHAFLLSQNGGEGFTLPNLSEQYNVPGALVILGSDWVGTTNRGIHLVYSAPDWVLEGIPTDPSVSGGGGGGGGSVGPGTVGTLSKFGPATSSITNSLVTEDATKLNVLEILHPNSIALNNTYTLLDADNIVLTIGNGLHDLESDDPVAANRTFTLADGTEDNFELLLVWHTNAGELINSGNMILSTNWVPVNGDMLQLIWDAVGKWREQWRYPSVGGTATATNVLWALDVDALVPDPAVGLVSIVSTLSDNATNVVLNLDTANAWTGGKQLLMSNLGTNFFSAFNNGLNTELVLNDLSLFTAGGSAATEITASTHQVQKTSEMFGQAMNDDGTTFFASWYMESAGDGNSFVELYSTADAYTNELVARLSANGSASDLSLLLSLSGNPLTRLDPLVTSTGSAVAYLFDTSNALTTGDLLMSIGNAGSTRATIDYDGNGFFSGTLSIGSLTNTLLRSAEKLVYTNSSSSALFQVQNASATASFGLNAGGNTFINSSSGAIYLGASLVSLSMLAATTNTYDIGNNGANSYRNLFLDGTIRTGDPSSGTPFNWQLGGETVPAGVTNLIVKVGTQKYQVIATPIP